VRVFVDEGRALAELLLALVRRGSLPEHLRAYALRLLSAFGIEDYGPQVADRLPPQPGLSEPLSERELAVLRLLTTSLSSTEIARELVVSVNTVRSHVKSIYSKLNVHSRYEAAARAKELNLL
jgi:LuxR family maltose regulon positive regulatory protein